jgi:hypothetical protein
MKCACLQYVIHYANRVHLKTNVTVVFPVRNQLSSYVTIGIWIVTVDINLFAVCVHIKSCDVSYTAS